MLDYPITTDTFFTPRGKPVTMAYRRDTSDWNTLYSCLNEDEYGLRDVEWLGLQVALDIGAHIGGVAIGLAMDHPDLFVTAVEAVPENADLLEQNAEQNGVLNRINVICGAAGSTPGEQIIHYRYRGDETHEHHAFIGNISLFGKGPANCPDQTPHEHVTVPVVTLAELPRPDLIKIDCEGGEWEFLSDDPSAPLIVGEWHPTDGHTQADFSALLPQYEIIYQGPKVELPPETWMGFRAMRR